MSAANRHLSNNTLGNGVDAASNSWNLTVTVSAADFVSIDTTGVTRPRLADGSLPALGLMKLVQGSDLIDKGVDVKLPYAGTAPDLGAYEYNLQATGIASRGRPLPRTLLSVPASAPTDVLGRRLLVRPEQSR